MERFQKIYQQGKIDVMEIRVDCAKTAYFQTLKGGFRMKKYTALVLALVCVLGLVGCGQKAVRGSEVYSFPEPATPMTVSFYSQGQETVFEIGSEEHTSHDSSAISVINWFYELELTACDEPEAAEGSESYDFYVQGEHAFIYEDRGSEAYIIVDGDYYKVSNPSAPPIG